MFSSQKPQNTMSSGQYIYHHNCEGGSLPAVDIHDIFINNTNSRGFLVYLSILMLFPVICHLFLTKEITGIWKIFPFVFTPLLVLSWRSNQVKKERVIILSGFGVQLERHYESGSVRRRFVPVGKLLRPVLNECVTPVTCYWSLSLILRDEDVLMLVFQELRPPVKMLVPIWKSLCAAVDYKEDEKRVGS